MAFVDDAYSDGAPAKRRRLDNLAGKAKRLIEPDKIYGGVGDDIKRMMVHDLQRASRRALAAAFPANSTLAMSLKTERGVAQIPPTASRS